MAATLVFLDFAPQPGQTRTVTGANVGLCSFCLRWSAKERWSSVQGGCPRQPIREWARLPWQVLTHLMSQQQSRHWKRERVRGGIPSFVKHPASRGCVVNTLATYQAFRAPALEFCHSAFLPGP